MSDHGWTWDSFKSSHYRWLEDEQCYLYENGTKVPVHQQTQPSASSVNVPRSTRAAEATNTFAYQQQSHQLAQSPNAGTSQTGTGSTNTSSNAELNVLTRQIGGLNVNQDIPQYTYGQQQSSSWTAQHTGYPATLAYSTQAATSSYSTQTATPSYSTQAATSPYGAHPSTAQAQHYVGSNTLPTSLHTGPAENITDVDLYQKGARARGMIKGTKGEMEELDAAFYIRNKPRDFFVVGKVIKILWPELPGNNVDGMTVISDARFEKEKIITKIRWFVVVKEGRECCTCVPISTYGRRGCGKKGLAKWQHCIAYTGREVPDLLPGETPGKAEQGMLTPIRVRPAQRGESMYKESRINFAKIYTVEHNVKVYDFGNVHERSLPQLVASWDWVLNVDLNGKPKPVSEPTPHLQPLANQPLQTVIEGVPSVPPGVPPIHGSAISAWTDTINENQLHFQPHDRIYVETHVSDDWSRGRNESTRLEGLFPKALVTLDSPDYATALCDQKYDKKKPGQLAFSRGDRILRLAYDNPTMDKGLNVTTNKEGRYQYNHVKMDRGRYAMTICKWVDEESLDQLRYTTQDRILVTYWPEDGAAWGRNERTGREGQFPRDHVKFA